MIKGLMREQLRAAWEFFLALVTRFREERATQTAGSLTYTTLLSLVPLFTVALAITTAFPVFDEWIGSLQLFVLENVLPDTPAVETIFDQEIEARGFDKMRSVVEVDLKDGRKLVQPSDERYRGGPERPFTRAELHDKFTDCAGLLLSAERIRHALDLIESVDQLKSVRELVQAMAKPA